MPAARRQPAAAAAAALPTWRPKRSKRYKEHGERYRHYIRSSLRRWVLLVGVVGVAFLAQHMEWIAAPAADAQDPLAPEGACTTAGCLPPHAVSNPTWKKYGGFNKMNYPYARHGKPVYTQGYETTGELLEDFVDDTGKPYKEHRWALTGGRSGGIDYIVRYPPDWTFCYSYILVPGENTWWQELRAFFYLITLLYVFLGVAIVADVFMSGIEKITSEKPLMTKGPDGYLVPEVDLAGRPVMVKTWNETVANLTLLALGSSAPEILLSLMETISSLDQEPGELGPSTIVGSAAFNLLCITGVCTAVMPATKEGAKRVKEFGVFCITSFFSLFAYIWVLIVLQINTPDVVDMWEAWLTFAFFPILVILCYCQDRQWFRAPKVEPESATEEMTHADDGASPTGADCDAGLPAEIIRVAVNGDNLTEDEIAEKVAEMHKPKLNRGHYRVNATRMMVAKQPVLHTHNGLLGVSDTTPTSPKGAPRDYGIVQFKSPAYVCSEGDGHIVIEVTRTRSAKGEVTAKYATQDLTARKGKHYHAASGELIWADGDKSTKTFQVQVIDDAAQNAHRTLTVSLDVKPSAAAGSIAHTVITIEDDDHPGEFQFSDPFIVVSESDKVVRIPVCREGGSGGASQVRYHTEDGEVGDHGAVDGQDYVGAKDGLLEFGHGEKNKYIDIQIIDDFDYSEKLEHFFVCLDAAELVSLTANAHRKSLSAVEPTVPKLGRITRCRVDITNDKEHHDMVDRIQQKVRDEIDVNSKIWSGSWGQQFRDAFTIGGDEEDLSPMHYVMHFLTFLWKVIFATIPPPDYAGGWACFGVALLYIGLVTKMVEETATLLGCSMGLEKPVTAITFVALGTSLPDTFASKQAAEEEETADAAIGNVTGSNSVNVFLGLGLPWVVACSYYTAQDICFILPAGDLAFSVMIFAICGALCLGTLFFLRLCHPQKAELGGPLKGPLTVFFVALWIVYVVASSIQVYQNFAKDLKSTTCPTSCLDGSKPNSAIVENFAGVFPHCTGATFN